MDIIESFNLRRNSKVSQNLAVGSRLFVSEHDAFVCKPKVYAYGWFTIGGTESNKTSIVRFSNQKESSDSNIKFLRTTAIALG